MTLALNTDASYLSEHGGKIQAAAYMFLTNKDELYFHNGVILTLSVIIKHAISYASEVEIGKLYYGWKSYTPLRTTLEELVHFQEGSTQVTTDNSTSHGLILDRII